jgi:hypothetical protein
MITKTAPGTALVTGASSGIGAIYADRLAERGYDLVLVARRGAELETLARAIAARTGRKVDLLVADLSEAEGQTLVERRIGEDDAVSLLVNSAGTVAGGPFPGSDMRDIEKLLAVNVVALTRLTAAAVSAFAARGRGTIVNIASAMAVVPSAQAGAYAASKAYVLQLSRSLQEAVSRQGLHVQAVLPGYTRTPMIDGLVANGLPAEMIMPTEDMVDAALAGLDRGEMVTVPSLPDLADWEAFEAARLKITENISRDQPAERYRSAKAAA